MNLKEQTSKLNQAKSLIRAMGGEAEVAKQHSRGKLTARERVDFLCEGNSFQEFGILVHHTSKNSEMANRQTPADGVICGIGTVAHHPVAIIAYDFTVMAGSMGKNGEEKVTQMRKLAMARQIPIIWLLDSAGARIQELAGSQFAGTGGLFRDQVTMSGLVPQIAAVMGPTAAGTSYIAALADFVPIVKGIGTMALAGPPLVKAAIGEVVDVETLGGSKVHSEKSGCAHLECEDDRECLTAIKTYLSFLPTNFRSPRTATEVSTTSLRRSDEIFEIMPESQRQTYNVKKAVQWLGDANSFFELSPAWAKNIVTGFLRIGGLGVGVVANQPNHMGGALDLDAADKAARFINLCDAFGVPLIFLHDTPGFWVGTKMEHAGIIRHGAKMLYAVSRLTVPKISVILRKSYGAGYYVMCGKGYAPDLIVAWPGAEVSLMSPEGAVNIINREGVERDEMVQKYREMIGAELSAKEALIDDVIDPRDTAELIYTHLQQLLPKHDIERAQLKDKKHGVSPV